MRLILKLLVFVFIMAISNSALSLTHVCTMAIQCDHCSTGQQWNSAALSKTPDIPPGYSSLECDVHAVNLNSRIVKRFMVHKYQEHQLHIQLAGVQSIDFDVELAFNDFFDKLDTYESTEQSITIPINAIPVDSAYTLPGNSQYQNAVADYITDNHPIYNGIYRLLGGSLSVIDATGLNLSRFLTIVVNFPDGSSGLFRLTVLGVGVSEWFPVESTFYDADGNRIYFDSSEYNGAQGNSNGASVPFLISRLSLGGWSLIFEGDDPFGGGSCSFSCSGDTCTINCITESTDE